MLVKLKVQAPTGGDSWTWLQPATLVQTATRGIVQATALMVGDQVIIPALDRKTMMTILIKDTA